MKNIANFILIMAIAVMFPLTGCSVGMALSGKENKDASILFPGAPRAVVIAKLGVPDVSTRDKNGNWVDSYLITEGNESSEGRAAMHAGLNLLTFFTWELIGTAWELGAGHEEVTRVLVYYNENDEVTNVQAIAKESSTIDPSAK